MSVSTARQPRAPKDTTAPAVVVANPREKNVQERRAIVRLELEAELAKLEQSINRLQEEISELTRVREALGFTLRHFGGSAT